MARQVHQGFLKNSSCSQSFLIFLQQNQEMQPLIRMFRLIEISTILIILIIYFFMFYITKINLDAFKFKNYNSSKVIYYQKVIISHIRFINNFLNDSHPICITENGDKHQPYAPPWQGEGYVNYVGLFADGFQVLRNLNQVHQAGLNLIRIVIKTRFFF